MENGNGNGNGIRTHADTAQWINPILGGGYPTCPILGGGWVNLPTPVISFNNGAMGMKLGMYLKYHEKFSISSKNFDGCADIGIFFC